MWGWGRGGVPLTYFRDPWGDGRDSGDLARTCWEDQQELDGQMKEEKGVPCSESFGKVIWDELAGTKKGENDENGVVCVVRPCSLRELRTLRKWRGVGKAYISVSPSQTDLGAL